MGDGYALDWGFDGGSGFNFEWIENRHLTRWPPLLPLGGSKGKENALSGL